MLSTLGRGLAPMANYKPVPFRLFNFVSTMPSEVTFLRNSQATYLDVNGKLQLAGVNEPCLDHLEDGTPLGLRIEHGATNKCANHNVNPIDTSEFLTNNLGVLSVVDDNAELTAAGLDEICTSGKVYKAEATSSSTFIVYILGNTNNLNPHSISLYGRGEGSSGPAARLTLGNGIEKPIAEIGDGYKRHKFEDITPSSTGRKFTIAINGNETLYFILNQMEEGDHCSSVIPIYGDDVTRPTERAYVNNIDLQNWFDPNQGYMICRYRLAYFDNNDAYIAVYNDGGSTDTIGFRVEKNDRYLKGYVRAASSSQHASNNEDKHLPNILNSAGLRWNTTDIDIISGGSIDNSSMNTLPTGINALEIGARNGGANPMNGHILSLEVGVRDLSAQLLGQKLQKPHDLCVIGAGQSLIRGYFISQADGSDGGKQQFRQDIGTYEPSKSIILIDGSTGSSAASKTSDETNYWHDLATQTRGPAFDNFYNQINDVGAKPTAILWSQGETDAFDIDINTTANQYKQALESIFTDMRQNLGDIPVYIQPIGRRNGFTNTGGIQKIRDIQKEIIDENLWCFDAAETYDLSLFDDVHLTNNAYVTAAQRNALTLADRAGKTGPQITTVSRINNIITLSLEHDAGDDFTPTTAIEGFKFFKGSSEVAITSAIKINPTSVEITLSTTPGGADPETLYYGYDDIAGININNIITDNADIPMPLRTTKITLT